MTKDDLMTLLAGRGRGLPLFWAWALGMVMSLSGPRLISSSLVRDSVVVLFYFGWCPKGLMADPKVRAAQAKDRRGVPGYRNAS